MITKRMYIEYLAWISLKVKANEFFITIYQVHEHIFDDFLTLDLCQPPDPANMRSRAKA